MTITATAPVTAEVMNRALWTHFAQQSWAVLFEFGARAKDHKESGRRIDVLAARPARRMGLGPVELLAIEVKVTRADFLQDVRRPEKQAAWKRTAHRHAYAVPKGLVTKDEVPDECGLIEVEVGETHSTVGWTKRPPYTDTDAIPGWLISNVMLRCSWAEGQMKGYSGVSTYDRDGSDTVESLRARLRAETKAREIAANKASRYAAERDLWKAAFAAQGGLPCEFCAQAIKPGRPGHGGTFQKWVHVKRTDEEVCELAREKRAADEAQAAWDAKTEEERQQYRDRHTYGTYKPTDDELIRQTAYAPSPRPADNLLPEGVTPV